MTQEQYQWLKNNGYDPAVHDVDDQGNIFRSPINAPAPKKEIMSMPRAFGTSFLGNLLPAGAGLGAGSLLAPLALSNPWTGIPAVIAGSLAAGYGTGKAQQAVLENYAPEALQEMQRAETDQPVASWAGGAAPALLTFKPSFKGIEGLSAPLMRGRDTFTKFDPATISRFTPAAVNVGVNAASAGAGQLINMSEGGDFSLPRFAADTAFGSIVSNPNALGRRMGFPSLTPQRGPVNRLDLNPESTLGSPIEESQKLYGAMPEGSVGRPPSLSQVSNADKSAYETYSGYKEPEPSKSAETLARELYSAELSGQPGKPPSLGTVANADKTAYEAYSGQQPVPAPEVVKSATDAAREIYTRLQGSAEEGPLKITQEDLDVASEIAAVRGLKLQFADLGGGRGRFQLETADGVPLIEIDPNSATRDTAIHEIGHDVFARSVGEGMKKGLLGAVEESPTYRAEYEARVNARDEQGKPTHTEQQARDIALEEGLIKKFGEEYPNVKPGEIRQWFNALKASVKDLAGMKLSPEDATSYLHYLTNENVPWKGVAAVKTGDVGGEERFSRAKELSRRLEIDDINWTNLKDPDWRREITLEEIIKSMDPSLKILQDKPNLLNEDVVISREPRLWMDQEALGRAVLTGARNEGHVLIDSWVWDSAVNNESPKARERFLHVLKHELGHIDDAPNVGDHGSARDERVANEFAARYQRGQQETPKFKNWFGESKVVDADGKPLRVYHGTPFGKFSERADSINASRESMLAARTKAEENFGAAADLLTETRKKYGRFSSNPESARARELYESALKDLEAAKQNIPYEEYTGDVFRTTQMQDRGYLGAGFYFTPNKNEATGYSGTSYRPRVAGEEKTPYVYETYLSIKKPYTGNEPIVAPKTDANAEYRLSGIKDIDARQREQGRITRDRLIESGFDGVIRDAGNGIEYVAFYPEQIKSATENKGTFDPSNPDIRYQRPVDEQPSQEISSADTSRPQRPAVFNSDTFIPRGTNIDIGAGKFDIGKQYLENERGVTESVPFDPFNRSVESNQAAVERLQSGERFGTATSTNVLNVIAETSARDNVILQAARAIEPEGVAYFQIHEGDRSGIGGKTPFGFQNNKKTADYVEEIRQHFDDVRKTGNVIVASNPKVSDRKAFWQLSPDVEGPSVRYQRPIVGQAKDMAQETLNRVSKFAELDNLESRGGIHAVVAKGMKAFYATRSFMEGKPQAFEKAVYALSPERQVMLGEHIGQEFDQRRFIKPASEIAEAYAEYRQQWQKFWPDAANKAGHTIRAAGGQRERLTDPYYGPFHMWSDNVRDIMTNKQGSPEYVKLQDDYIKQHVQAHQQRGIPLQEAQTRAAAEFSEEIRALSVPYDPTAAGTFAGARKAQGIPLPHSWREYNIVKLLKSYDRRSAIDFAMQEHMEKSPEIMAALGSKTFFNDQPIPAQIKAAIPDISTDKSVQSILREMSGQPAFRPDSVGAGASRGISALTIGTISKVTEVPTTMIAGLRYLQMSDYLPGTMKFIEKLADWSALQERSYASGLNKRDSSQNMRQVSGVAENAAGFLNKFAEGVSSVTGLNKLESAARTLAQGWGEVLVQINKNKAATGDKDAVRMLDSLSPDWRTRSDADLAAQFGKLMQGSYDMTQLPAWMLESGAAPYLTWMKWSAGQYSNFVKFAIEPAMQGNVKPLIGHLLIGVMGGAAVDQIREWMNNREGRDVNWSELESWMQQNQGQLGAEGMKQLSVKLLNMVQSVGTFGIAGDIAKMVTTAAVGGSAQGVATAPVANAVFDTSKKVAAALKAIDDGEDFGLVLRQAMGDIAQTHIQVARVARNWLDEQENLRYDDRRQRRLFDELIGAPSKGGAFAVNYSNLAERDFERGDITEKTGEEAFNLVSRARKDATSGEDYASRIRKLKTSQNAIMPSLERQPQKAARYLSFVEGAEPGKGGETLKRYYTRQNEDKYRKSLIEGMSGIR